MKETPPPQRQLSQGTTTRICCDIVGVLLAIAGFTAAVSSGHNNLKAVGVLIAAILAVGWSIVGWIESTEPGVTLTYVITTGICTWLAIGLVELYGRFWYPVHTVEFILLLASASTAAILRRDLEAR